MMAMQQLDKCCENDGHEERNLGGHSLGLALNLHREWAPRLFCQVGKRRFDIHLSAKSLAFTWTEWSIIVYLVHQRPLSFCSGAFCYRILLNKNIQQRFLPAK